jgi:membrane associated rhomboid family serine protease
MTDERSEPETATATATEPPGLMRRLRTSPVTFALAIINVAVFVAVEQVGSSMDTGTLLRFGAGERTHVLSGELWRVLTPMFLHIGLQHLAWNTYASFGFCTLVESIVGKARFLAIYLVSGVAGAAASAIVWNTVGAGASGAMYGVVGAMFALRYRVLGSAVALVSDRWARGVVGQIAIWTVIGLVALSVDHAAHFGGLVFGALAGLAATSRRRVLPWGVLLASIGALVAAAAHPGMVPDEATAERAAQFAFLWSRGEVGEPAAPKGFTKDVPRALRLAELACRAPSGRACLEVAQHLAACADGVLAAHGRDMLKRSCSAGRAEACAEEHAPGSGTIP